MIKNYLKIAWRNLWKHKTFTVINITGLAVAFGVVLLLSLTAFYELSYDNFHENRDSIFQVYMEQHGQTGIERGNSLPVPLTPALIADFPELVNVSRFGDIGGGVIRYQNKDFNYDVRTVDPGFLKMFTFPVLKGNKTAPLKNLNDLIITEQTAANIFGKEEPVGKIVQVHLNNQWQPFTISAIVANQPDNSSISFNGLVRFEQFPGYAADKEKWGTNNHLVYLQLPAKINQAQFEQNLKKFAHKYFVDVIKQLKADGGKPDNEHEYLRFRLISLNDLHFSKSILDGTLGGKIYPYFLLLISLFILFIATVNFVNLSLGRTFTRAKEIGVRKVLGAGRLQILVQFCSESLLTCTGALLAGALLAWYCAPQYKLIFNQHLSLTPIISGLLPVYFVAGFVLVSMISGAYPAWQMASLKTSQTVKGTITTGRSNKLRDSLMVMQFTLSGLLIICTAIAWQQLNFLRQMPLGYDKKQVISIPIGSNIDPGKALYLMRSQLAAIPNVVSVTGTDMNMGRGRDNSASTSILGFEYKGKTVKTSWRRVDFDYTKTLGLKLLSGRDFSRTFGADTNSVLINEKMAAQLGEPNPVGKIIPMNEKKYLIAGLVKDFNFQSLHEKIMPLTMMMLPNWSVSYIFVRVKAGDLPGSMASVTKAWKQINPKAEFDPSFLDENVDKQYRSEDRLSKIFISGAVVAIIISCMGLFAIALLVIAQRTKEIGIRKVLGANVITIVALISRDFLKLIAVAVLIASPIAWYLMNKWLRDFAYRITVSGWIFVFTGITILFVALATVGLQTVKAALVNPVKSLKSE